MTNDEDPRPALGGRVSLKPVERMNIVTLKGMANVITENMLYNEEDTIMTIVQKEEHSTTIAEKKESEQSQEARLVTKRRKSFARRKTNLRAALPRRLRFYEMVGQRR